jgi:hypothetical protein
LQRQGGVEGEVDRHAFPAQQSKGLSLRILTWFPLLAVNRDFPGFCLAILLNLGSLMRREVH